LLISPAATRTMAIPSLMIIQTENDGKDVCLYDSPVDGADRSINGFKIYWDFNCGSIVSSLRELDIVRQGDFKLVGNSFDYNGISYRVVINKKIDPARDGRDKIILQALIPLESELNGLNWEKQRLPIISEDQAICSLIIR
jgi:hypothetical protein